MDIVSACSRHHAGSNVCTGALEASLEAHLSGPSSSNDKKSCWDGFPIANEVLAAQVRPDLLEQWLPRIAGGHR